MHRGFFSRSFPTFPGYLFPFCRGSSTGASVTISSSVAVPAIISRTCVSLSGMMSRDLSRTLLIGPQPITSANHAHFQGWRALHCFCLAQSGGFCLTEKLDRDCRSRFLRAVTLFLVCAEFLGSFPIIERMLLK